METELENSPLRIMAWNTRSISTPPLNPNQLPPCDHDECPPTHCTHAPLNPTELEKAIERLERWFDNVNSYSRLSARLDLKDIVSAAKRTAELESKLKEVEKERDKLQNNLKLICKQLCGIPMIPEITPENTLVITNAKSGNPERRCKTCKQSVTTNTNPPNDY